MSVCRIDKQFAVTLLLCALCCLPALTTMAQGKKGKKPAAEKQTKPAAKQTRAAGQSGQPVSAAARKTATRKPDGRTEPAVRTAGKNGARGQTKDKKQLAAADKNKRTQTKASARTQDKSDRRGKKGRAEQATAKDKRTERLAKVSTNGKAAKDNNAISSKEKAAAKKTVTVQLPERKVVSEKKSVTASPPVQPVAVAETQVAVVPDIIVVREYDPSHIGTDPLAGTRRPLRVGQPADNAFNISSRRIEVQIDSERINEIQQALSRTGFYQGEPTGVWDDATYDAMKRYQISRRIDATGYPTAHSLKRLGLTRW